MSTDSFGSAGRTDI